MEDGEEEELNTKKPSGSYSTSEQGEQAPPAYAAGSVRSEPADAGKGGKRNDDNKKANRCALIVAIFGLLFALAAIVPTVFCHLLWWYWVWTLTTPALFFGFIGLILAAVKKREAASCCAGFAIVLGLAAIVWGSFEVIQSQSYQGKLDFVTLTIDFTMLAEDKKAIAEWGSEARGEIKDYNKFQVNASEVSSHDDALMKAYHYHLLGWYCNGRAYDWNYRKTIFVDEIKCNRKTEDWYIKKFVTVSGSRYEGCGTNQAFDGVDTYTQSPVYLTHEDMVEAKKYVYASDALKKEKQKVLDEFCKDFKVEKFEEAREKCDKEIKSSFEPKCKKENGGMMFTKGFEDNFKKIQWMKFNDKVKIWSSQSFDQVQKDRKKKLREILEKGDCGKMLLQYEGFAIPKGGGATKIEGKWMKKTKAAKPIFEETKSKYILLPDGVGKMQNLDKIFAKAKFEFTKTQEVDGDEVRLPDRPKIPRRPDTDPGQSGTCKLTEEENVKDELIKKKWQAIKDENQFKRKVKDLEEELKNADSKKKATLETAIKEAKIDQCESKVEQEWTKYLESNKIGKPYYALPESEKSKYDKKQYCTDRNAKIEVLDKKVEQWEKDGQKEFQLKVYQCQADQRHYPYPQKGVCGDKPDSDHESGPGGMTGGNKNVIIGNNNAHIIGDGHNNVFG